MVEMEDGSVAGLDCLHDPEWHMAWSGGHPYCGKCGADGWMEEGI